MTPSYFAALALGIGDQAPPLDRKGRSLFGLSAACWLCGGPTIGKGWRQADAFPATFTQVNCAAIPDSDAVCQNCIAITSGSVFQKLIRSRDIQLKLWSQCGWHSYSHIVQSDGAYEAPKPSRVRELLIDPPRPPFLIGLNQSGQKHSLFRSRVAMSRDLFPVHTDEETILVDRSRFASLLADLERMSLLGFSKEQSASGRYHPESIRRAGLVPWRQGESKMSRWRSEEPALLSLAAWVGRGPRWFAEDQEKAGP